jgi:hypothetical protein
MEALRQIAMRRARLAQRLLCVVLACAVARRLLELRALESVMPDVAVSSPATDTINIKMKQSTLDLPPSYLGQSRRAAAAKSGRQRIALISNAAMWPDAEKGADLLRRYDEYFANKQCYVQVNKYSHI